MLANWLAPTGPGVRYFRRGLVVDARAASAFFLIDVRGVSKRGAAVGAQLERLGSARSRGIVAGVFVCQRQRAGLRIDRHAGWNCGRPVMSFGPKAHLTVRKTVRTRPASQDSDPALPVRSGIDHVVVRR